MGARQLIRLDATSGPPDSFGIALMRRGLAQSDSPVIIGPLPAAWSQRAGNEAAPPPAASPLPLRTDPSPSASPAAERDRLAGKTAPHAILSEEALLDAAAEHFQFSRIDPLAELAGSEGAGPDLPRPEQIAPALIDRLGLSFCQSEALLPWRAAGAVTLVLTARPQNFARLRPQIEARLGPVAMALCTEAALQEALQRVRGAVIAAAAENRVSAAESCRGWGGARVNAALLGLMIALIAGFILAPRPTFFALLGLSMFAMVAASALKLAAALCALRRPAPEPPLPETLILPKISVIVALYHESDIAPRLVRRLSRLDYPKDRLEVILAIEAGDTATRAALTDADLPPWMRLVIAPPGRVMTKPRALNIALTHCQGEIIGIYDAEDAPEPDQLHKIVETFHRQGEKTACIQGVLDFYNPETNWISRCFTIEYASWFRLVLPGIARMGLMVPLGGTTLFIRRSVLEEIGAWDSHNVTEDADLGIRLARRGYRTALVSSATREEANCRTWAWIRQRSRWIKGHMMTWAVHMRHPLRLIREIGFWPFIGFQVMFPCAALQWLLAPLIWSFWLLAAGLPHPLADSLPQPLVVAMLCAFLLAAVTDFAIGLIALRLSGQKVAPCWVFSLHPYQALASFAGYKALHELIARPFYWDKTSHGHFDLPEAARSKSPQEVQSPA